MLIVSGSQQTLDLASKLFIDSGTEVLVEAPTYLAALQSFQLFGAQCLAVAQQADGPDLAALRSMLEQHAPAFAYLIPTFQNPSAVRYSEAKREAVADLLDEYGVTLLEDEPYRELVFDQGSARPIVSRLKRASWIYTGTVSKTLLPGLRVGYLIASVTCFICCASSSRQICIPIGSGNGRRCNGWAATITRRISDSCVSSTESAAMPCRRR